jgi:hypothetical protein
MPHFSVLNVLHHEPNAQLFIICGYDDIYNHFGEKGANIIELPEALGFVNSS